MKRDIKLELKTSGSILDCPVSLEEVQIGFWLYSAKDKLHYKNLKDYEIDGPLDVKMIAKGKNGAKATLTIKFSAQPSETLECTVQGGSTTKTKSITII